MKLGRAFLCVALAALCACRRSEPGKSAAEKPAAPPPRLKIVTERVSLADLERMPLDVAVRARRDVFRLRPDRRFLIALGELELLVTRKANANLNVSWTGDVWRIDSAGTAIGEVPELASYADLRRVLAERARSLASASAVAVRGDASLDAIRADAESFEAGREIRALVAAGERWPASGLPNSELASLAAEAAVALSVQSLDTLEIADLLRARALALLALAEAAGAGPAAADEALLAASLGYWPDAARVAASLPPDDPIRIYSEARTPALVEAANREGSSRRTRYLALASLGNGRKPAAWAPFQEAQFPGEGFSLPVLKTAAALDNFEIDASLGRATIYAAFDQLGGPPKERRPALQIDEEAAGPVAEIVASFVREIQARQKVQPAGLVREFESRLAPASAAAKGPLWDAHAVRAWHRGAFYSGLHRLGSRYLDDLASAEATREFVSYLQGSPEGTASQFARWYGDLSVSLLGGKTTDQHFDDLLALSALGAPAVRRLAEPLRGQHYRGDSASPLLVARVAERLDARPANVAFMEKLATFPLYDLRLVDGLCRAWLQQGWNDDPGTTGHCLRIAGDTRGLLALVNRRDVDVGVRANALGSYCSMSGSSENLCRPRFRELAAEADYDRSVVVPWSVYLEKKKDWAESQRVAESFVEHQGKSDGLYGYIYTGRAAHFMSLQGRDREAWQKIEPALRSGAGSVLLWAVQILEKLGRTDEAYTLARGAVDRYPDDPRQRAALAGVLWKQKRDSEAALALDPPEPGYKVYPFGFRDDVAPLFVEAFGKAPDEDVVRAFSAMRAQGIRTQSLAFLLPPLAAVGRNELAFRLQSMLTWPREHVWEVANWRREGFGFLEKAKGRPEAVAWIQAAIPRGQLDDTVSGMFWKKAWGLVWDVVPPAEEPKRPEWVWLLRTGSATADPAVAAAHGAALRERYREPKSGDPMWTLSRQLLGLEKQEAVLQSAKSNDDRCRAAYFFGLQDIVAGRYEDGSDWLQLVAANCSKPTSWELVGFALTTFESWHAFDQNLRLAAAAKVW